MNRTLKLFVICTIMLGGLLAVWANNRINPVIIKNAVENESAESSPRQLFVSNCARCHGADGKGNTQLGRQYDVPDLTVSAKQMGLAKVKSIISKGDGDMPGFSKKMKVADIAAVAKYVRSF